MRLALPVLLACVLPLCAFAQSDPVIPAKRMVYVEGQDFAGRDLAQVFDTTLESCERACLSRSDCEAITFNARNGSCFPKADVTGAAPYQGAFSGLVQVTSEATLQRGAVRLGDLGFLRTPDLAAARRQAEEMGRTHLVGLEQGADLARARGLALQAGDIGTARRVQGALVNLSDSSGDWQEYARLALRPDAGKRIQTGPAMSAAINGYLRAGNDATRASALMVLSEALVANGRPRQMVPALRLASTLSNREDIALALADAVAKYGFRIEDHEVEADSAEPRICARFNEELAKAGVDYATYVKLPAPGLAVEALDNRICVSGVEHGQRVTITFREGLPAASGETLAGDTEIAAYVRDRSPAVRFEGRAYILPRAADSGLPVVTVNAQKLDLRLLRVSDRNLVAAMREDFFARSLSYWSGEHFSDTLAEEVWTGSAEVGLEVNRDVVTRLPVQEVTGPLGPGIYVLEAAIPGAEPYDTPPAMQWFAISDLGLSTFSGADGLTVAVRGLSDAAAREGAEVTLVSRANSVLGTAATDADGVARFAPALAAGRGGAAPALVSVAQGEDIAFLSLDDPEFDLSDRGVDGMPAAPAIDLFLATDRGAYRAGETIHATILARDSEMRALPGLPLTAVLFRPDGVEYSRQMTQEAGAGGHIVALPIAGSAPRGTWRLDILADPKAAPLASHKLLVEDFLPERIDVVLDLPKGVLSGGDMPRIGIDARYLFGAPGAGLEVTGDLRLSAAGELPGWESYRFGRYDERFDTYTDSLGHAMTDAQGRAGLQAVLPEMGADARRPLEARFTVQVAEGSGRPVERSQTRVMLPADPVIGIRPMFDEVVPEGGEARFRIAAVGPDANAAPMPVIWTVNRVETRYQWYSYDGRWDWEAVTTRVPVGRGELALDAAGPQEIAVPVDWGRYEIVVERRGEPYTVSAMGFDAGWYAPAEALASPDRLELSLDQPAYRAGDVARLRIVPAADGVALVSVLSNRVIALKSVAVKAGENVIDLPVTEDWGAGAYVTASVIRPLAQAAGDRVPNRALGLAHAAVDPGARRLNARFDMGAEADPRAPMPVALKVEGAAPGQTVHATIAAVDLGILNLTGFKTPDPEGHYFGQRRLGVGLRDIYGRLIDGRSGQAGVIRSGGDDAPQMSLDAPPPTEDLLAYFSGPLVVGADGYARTAFDLPGFNGTVRLSAVVWSESAVGQASLDVLVRDPVVVTATLPRFMAPGDRSRLLLEIVHATGPSGEMALEVTGEGAQLGAAPGSVTLSDLGKQVVELPVTASDVAGLAHITVALTTPDGKRLEKVLNLPVGMNDPEIARQSRFELAAGQTFRLDANVFDGLRPGTGTAAQSAGPLARFDTAALLASLDRYPYGCTEQTTSRAMPLLYLSSVAEAMGLSTPAELKPRIEGAIAQVLTNQDASGSFGLWRPESGDLWLDAYVSDFLSRARAEGYEVPQTAFRNAMDNLRNRVNYAPDFDAGSNGGGTDVAYALMVLAREGAAAIADLRYYADEKAGNFQTPLAVAQIAAALAMYGDQTRADRMFAQAARMLNGPEDDRAPVWRADYGTALRDQAGVLALAAGAGSQAVPLEAIGQSLAERIRATPLSTQEAVWTLLATQALIDRPGLEGMTVNGAPAEGPLVRVLDAQTAGGGLEIANQGSAAQNLTLTTFGVPQVPEPAGGKGFTINRSYYSLQGAPLDLTRIAQGTRFVTVLEVIPHEKVAARLMVADPLAAGIEIDNPNLLRAGEIDQLDWLDVEDTTRMTEFRQDRFLAALDWQSDRPLRLAYIARAVSPGSFHQPAASVEDMYRPEMRAQTDAGRVTVE